MNKKRAKAWEQSLALWKKLGETKNCAVPQGDSFCFKNNILSKLGFKSCSAGCPFCEYLGCGRKDIVKCPLKNEGNYCCNTPFKAWVTKAENFLNPRHNQKLARKFYDYLVKLHEKESKKL